MRYRTTERALEMAEHLMDALRATRYAALVADQLLLDKSALQFAQRILRDQHDALLAVSREIELESMVRGPCP